VRLHERDVRLRLPFRFGAVTVTRGTQAFVRARVAREDGREAWGVAAEMLAAKWFDKDPALGDEDNLAQLRAALRIAADIYTHDGQPRTAFGLFAAHYRDQLDAGAAKALGPLVASYGPALLDRAVLDALGRLEGVSFYEAVRANLPGVAPAALLPEFHGWDVDRFLARLAPAATLEARHTVGLVDPITADDQDPAHRVGDGLPETLEEVVATYGNRYYKLKVGGRVDADVARLAAIAGVLDRMAGAYRVTLDGNEQYEDVEGVLALWDAVERAPALRRLVAATLFIEQPIARTRALEGDVARLAARRPVLIDESDGDLDAFPRARACGYAGVSSKTCKGVYKSLLNAARCARWNEEAGGPRYFMSAEDLTTQAGVSVQQDLALVSLLGLEHVERNGHHYVDGMAGLPAVEQEAFLAAHPDLYERSHGAVRLRLARGRLAIGSLACPGFAVAAEPDWTSMRAMAV
jgi:hypothetical protein